MGTEFNQKRAKLLGLNGLVNRWNEFASQDWVSELLGIEEEHRHRSGLERRLKSAKLAEFKPMANFDWKWPEDIDRALIEELMTLSFLDEKENIAFIGPNGVGKTMVAKNIAFEAVRRGKSALFMDAAALLTDLSDAETQNKFALFLSKFVKPDLLIIDEIGQVTFGNRHADLLFAVINRRYLKRSTIITTNTPFGQWGDLFPNATCVVTLVDRLLHRSEVVNISGTSFRLRESQERQTQKRTRRAERKKKTVEE